MSDLSAHRGNVNVLTGHGYRVWAVYTVSSHDDKRIYREYFALTGGRYWSLKARNIDEARKAAEQLRDGGTA